MTLDHFAIIDLGYGYSNRMQLIDIFSNLGFTLRNSDYLIDKKNDFAWMAESNCAEFDCHDAMPQAVIADFRTDEFSQPARDIVQKYASYQKPFDIDKFNLLMSQGDADEVAQFIFEGLSTRAWPMPTAEEYSTVLKENELAAWVLLFGRKVNHFGISIHLSNKSSSLDNFNNQLPASIELNDCGGLIKGGESVGIAQSSTLGTQRSIKLQGGSIIARDSFMEFVWRYPNTHSPKLWKDYYTGFLSSNANKVVESLFLQKESLPPQNIYQNPI